MAYLTLPRNGKFDMPPMVVVGRPLHYAGETHPIGAPFADNNNPIRMRQLYDQRRIAPATSPAASSTVPPTATQATTSVGSTVSTAAIEDMAELDNPAALDLTSADTELAASTQPTGTNPGSKQSKKTWGRR